MRGNKSAKGGCLQAVNSEIRILSTNFENNVGLQGGVIFAIKRSILEVTKCLFSNNIAEDGGIVYSMSNELTA